ncbi:carbohydrate kinase, FGGY-like protein [Pseudomonas sp. St290]|nr:carbohydrate kinase, FGGY-like protein [Pseudomonas sp. St290]
MRFVGDVGSQAQMAFAEGGRGITGGGLVEIQDHDASTVSGEGDSRCAADTTFGCGASDNRDLVLKKHEGYL